MAISFREKLMVRENFITGLLLVLGVLYLAVELFINGSMVSYTAIEVNPSDLQNIEKTMRTLSGIGASLLVANVLVGLFPNSQRKLMMVILTFCIVTPTVYVSIKVLVDGLVERSSTDDRKLAAYTYLYKMGLKNGTLKSDAMGPFADGEASGLKHRDQTERSALLASMGIFALPGGSIDRTFKDGGEALSQKIYTKELTAFPQNVHRFLKWGTDLSLPDMYKDYLTEFEKPLGSDGVQFKDKVEDIRTSLARQVESKREACLRYRVNRKDCKSFSQFSQAADVQQEVHKRLVKQLGIPIPRTYLINSPELFREAIRTGFINDQRAKGKKVPYPLSFDEFLKQKEVKLAIAGSTFPYYMDGLNPLRFEGIFKNIGGSAKSMASHMLHMDYSGEEGKSIYRLMYIPLIGLFLSMFFATLNIVSMAAGLITYRAKSPYLKAGFKVFMLSVALVYPLTMSNKVSESDWYQSHAKELKDYSLERYYVSKWMIHIEPRILGGIFVFFR
ncbi:hypothetical protein ACI2KR_08165 [Pseudomonas luteola]